MKRLMMKDVEEDVNKMFVEATVLYTKEVRQKQKKFVKNIFKKAMFQFEIKPEMSEKKKKLTMFANAIIRAARQIRGTE